MKIDGNCGKNQESTSRRECHSIPGAFENWNLGSYLVLGFLVLGSSNLE
jgi:hypothetical protein